MLLLSHFSRVRLCATPQTAATRLPRPWDSPGKNTGVGCHFLLQCMKVKTESEVAQSCPTLRDPMDCSLSGATLAAYFLRLETPGLPSCYPLIPRFSFRRIMLPSEMGRCSHSITVSKLTRGIVPKLVRQHIFLTVILRLSDLGAPSSSWKRLQQ